MMSKQVPVQSSSFSIRFRPASAVERKDELGCDDDVCNINDGSPSPNGSCEAVLFQRVSNSEELAPAVDLADGNLVTHPGNLCKNSQGMPSHSAPVSELTSPTLPSSVSMSPVITHEKPAASKSLTGSQQIAEKLSIFSGLKEKLDKLSTESKEIFDRKMKRSGSADAAKIASLLAEPGVTKLSAVKSQSANENSEFAAKSGDAEQIEELKSEVTEEPSDRDSSDSVSTYIHKSTSSIEVTKADILPPTAAMPKRASLGGEHVQEPVVMSQLLSSTSQPDNGQHSAAGVDVLPSSDLSQNISKDTQHATDVHCFRKPKRFIPRARFQYLLSFLIAVVAYIVIPMPTYISGMLAGAFLAAVGILLYQRLTRPRQAVATPSHNVWSSLTPVTADIRESKNVEGKFQVRITLDNIVCVWLLNRAEMCGKLK